MRWTISRLPGRLALALCCAACADGPPASAPHSAPSLARVSLAGVTADGLVLAPGEPRELTLELEGESSLRFRLHAEEPAPFELRWRVGGGEWSALAVSDAHELPSLELELPAREGELLLELESAGASFDVQLLTPSVGAGELGAPDARPWGAARPNVIVFMADTLRADVLSMYGGDPELTPELARFAAAGSLYEHAFSTSSWTLPAQASLLTGVYPYQHGTTEMTSRLGDGLTTLGEHLGAHGYRTAAVTDSMLVSSAHGLDRGFELFIEYEDKDVDRSVARSLDVIDADDGRPFFLYLQSYRVHAPYHAQQARLDGVREYLGLQHARSEELTAQLVEELQQALAQKLARGEGPSESEDRLVELFAGSRWTAAYELLLTMREQEPELLSFDLPAALERLYLATLADLDRAFGALLAGLEARGLLEDTLVIFTSDHGEAFGEHGSMGHSKGAWDEVLRIPLVLRGPGVAPGVHAEPASLADLPRTLCALLDLPPLPGWVGASLLDAPSGRTIYAFDCALGAEPLVMLVREDLKLVLPLNTDGRTARAPRYLFDREQDPGELHNLAQERALAGDASWSAAIEALDALMVPQDEAGAAELDAERLRVLQAIGYYGEDD